MNIDATQFSPSVEATKKFLSKQEKKMLIAGEWVDSLSGDTLTTHDPANGEVLASFPRSNKDDADRAVAAAKDTFDRGVWKSIAPSEKAKILWRVAELIDENIDELSELETLDQGKPLFVGRWAEIPGAAEQFRFFSGMCTKIESSVIPTSIGYQPEGKRVHAQTRLEPVGVVAAITPWNSPLILSVMKIAPALAAGCSIILKPAEDTSLTAIRLGELMAEAGVPAGVVNIVTGYGHEIGQALAEHQDVAKVTFTGSTATGRKILAAAQGNLKKVGLELGGKSPVIVMDDADLELAIPGVANAVFFNGGQVCVAGTRLYVHDKIADQLFAGIKEIAESMTLGHGLNPATQMGPVINQAQAEKINGFIEGGIKQGANLLTGGDLGGPNNTFISPTVLTDCDNSMDIMREEVFGPVLAAARFDDYDTVLAQANDSDYGLAASVWTEGLSNGLRFSEDLNVGTVWINSHLMYDAALPIGGYKQSGWGRDSGQEAVNNYLEIKTICAIY